MTARRAAGWFEGWTAADAGTLSTLLRIGLSDFELTQILPRSLAEIQRAVAHLAPAVWPGRSDEEIAALRRSLAPRV